MKVFFLALLIYFFFLPTILFAQYENKRKIQISSLLGGSFYQSNGVYPTYEQKYFRTLAVNPRIGYLVSDRLTLGVQGGRTFYKSNFMTFSIIRQLGIWGDYHLKTYTDTLMLGKRKMAFLGKLKVGLNYQLTNYGPTIQKKFDNISNQYNVHLLYPTVAMDIRIWKDVSCEIGLLLPFYYNAKDAIFKRKNPSSYFSINYLFNTKRITK